MYPTLSGRPEPNGIVHDIKAALPLLPIDGDKKYPLYAFFLHSEKDDFVAKYLKSNGPWLDALTGDDCLICTIEKPSNWDEGWKDAWKERLKNNFEKNYSRWEALTNYSANAYATSLANLLNVPLNHMPCMVFVEDLKGKRIIQIPIIANKEDYDNYFKDVLTCVHTAALALPNERISTLEREWGTYWCKWILPQKIKNMARSIQEWGSLICDTKNVVIEILDIISPIIKKIGFQ